MAVKKDGKTSWFWDFNIIYLKDGAFTEVKRDAAF